MEAVILEPGNEADFEKIKKFALKNKIPTSILSDDEYRFIERKNLLILRIQNIPS